jgi:hypothetical protein
MALVAADILDTIMFNGSLAVASHPKLLGDC